MQFVLYMTYLLYHAENMYYNIYNINSKWDPDYSGSLVRFRTPELPRWSFAIGLPLLLSVVRL